MPLRASNRQLTCFTHGRPGYTIVRDTVKNNTRTLVGRNNNMRRAFSMWVLPVMVGTVLCAGGKLASAADEYAYDLVHSSVGFKARHLDISWIHGRFNEVDGKFSLDREHPSKSTFELTIKADSVDTANKARDEHLRQPDYFDTKQFPTIEFKSTSAKAVAGRYEVAGGLPKHGESRGRNFGFASGKENEF